MKKIKELVSINNDFEPVIDLKWLKNEDISKKLIDNYILTPYLLNRLFINVLDSISKSGERIDSLSHMIQGAYGTGKSYALIILNILLSQPEYIQYFKDKASDNKINSELLEIFFEKIDRLKQKSFLSISVDISQFVKFEFDSIIMNQIESIASKMNINLVNPRIDKAVKHLNVLPESAKNLFNHELNTKYGIDIEMLKKEIKSLGNAGLEKYRDICALVFGQDSFEIKVPLSTVLSEFTKELKKRDLNLVFLIDEFSPYILYWAQDKKEFINILTQIQDFAEFCYSKINNMSLLCVSHIHMDDFRRTLPNDFIETYNKVLGRFDTITLESFDFEQMVEKVLDRDVQSIKEVINSNTNIYTLNQLKEISNAYKIDFYNYFPYHPYTIKLLPFLSTRIGQSERTSFKFLMQLYKDFSEIDAFENSNLSTIKPYNIFDYYEEIIKNRNDTYYASYLDAWKLAKSIYKGEEILKTLYITYLSSGIKLENGRETKYVDNGLPAQHIAMILQESLNSVQGSLKQLLSCNYIFYNEINTRYGFMPSEGINPTILSSDIINAQALLEEQYRDDDLLDEIRDVLKLSKSDFITNPLERYFLTDICFVKNVKDRLFTRREGVFWGKVLYIIPDKENIDGYKEDITFLFSQEIMQNKKNVFVVFERIDFNYKSLYKIFAIRKLLQDKKYDNDYAKAFLSNQLRQFQEDILNTLKSTFKTTNYKCFWSGNFFEKSAHDLLFDVDNEINNRFPKVNVDFLRKGVGTSLIRYFISNGQYNTNNTDSKTSEMKKLIANFLVPLGLAKYNDDNSGFFAVISTPEPQNDKSYSIWDFIQKTIKSRDTVKSPIQHIFSILALEPTGLNDEIISLYIAVLIKLGKVSLMNSYTGEIINESRLNDSVLKDLMKYKDNKYEFRDFSDVELKEYLEVLNFFDFVDEKNEVKTLKMAYDTLTEYCTTFSNCLDKASNSLGLLEIESSYLNHLKLKMDLLLVQEKGAKDFLIETKEIVKSVNTTIKINNLINILNNISFSIQKLFICKNIISIKNSHNLRFSFCEDLQDSFVKLEEYYKNFSNNYLDIENLKKLLEYYNRFILRYIDLYKIEHENFNNLKKQYREKLITSQQYKLCETIIEYDSSIEPALIEFTNYFSECSTNINEDIVVSFLIGCPNCRYILGSDTGLHEYLENKYSTFLFSIETLINNYIDSIPKSLDKVNAIKSKDLGYLGELKNKNLSSFAEKLNYIKTANKVLKEYNIRPEKQSIKKENIIRNFDGLKEMINNAEISSTRDLIKIIFNWINKII